MSSDAPTTSGRGLLGWLQSTETPRWVVITGFILSTLVVSSVNFGLDYQKRVADARQSDVRTLISSMDQFQIHVAAFSAEIFETKQVSAAARKALVENLNDQFNKLKTVEPLVRPSDKVVVDGYRAQLLAMRQEVSSTSPDIIAMNGFWSSVSRFVVARNKLAAALRSTL